MQPMTIFRTASWATAHQFRTRNELIKAQRTRSNPNETAVKSTKLIDIPPLITVWLQVRVLPGPPRFALTGYGWRSHVIWALNSTPMTVANVACGESRKFIHHQQRLRDLLREGCAQISDDESDRAPNGGMDFAPTHRGLWLESSAAIHHS
jgi:hypothetical protein